MLNRALPLMFAALCFAACGSSSTTKHPDAHVNGPDASTTPDAPGGGTPDAAAAGLTGFGQQCNPQTNPTTCPTSANTCDALSSTATNGWCAPGCGQGAYNADPSMIMPPTGGDAMCKTALTAAGGTTPTDGTPACVIYVQDATDATKADWTCGLLCGMYMTTNFGGCPGGLTCNATDNICE